MMAMENDGLHISINGMRYRLCLSPEGKTADVIRQKSQQLHETLKELSKMEKEKRPLDAKAARHTKRMLGLGLVYLLGQVSILLWQRDRPLFISIF